MKTMLLVFSVACPAAATLRSPTLGNTIVPLAEQHSDPHRCAFFHSAMKTTASIRIEMLASLRSLELGKVNILSAVISPDNAAACPAGEKGKYCEAHPASSTVYRP